MMRANSVWILFNLDSLIRDWIHKSIRLVDKMNASSLFSGHIQNHTFYGLANKKKAKYKRKTNHSLGTSDIEIAEPPTEETEFPYFVDIECETGNGEY